MKNLAKTFLAVLLFAALVQTCLAQNNSSGGPGPVMQEGGGTPQEFSEIKSRILTMIEERQKRIGQEKSCVEAATNIDELKKCRPVGPMNGRGGQFQGGPGQQRSQQGGMGAGR